MRYGLLIAIVLLALSGTQAFADEPTVEDQLATFQTGGPVAADDPLVLAYANVLDRVEPRCNESRLQLGKIAAVLAAKVDRESPYRATPLSLLAGLDEAATPELYGPDHPGNCGEILAVVAFLVSQGD